MDERREWKRVPSPNLDPRDSPADNELRAVDGIGHDIWAVGSYDDPGDHEHAPGRYPLIVHDDGSGWTITPADVSHRAELLDVVRVGPEEVWAVGFTAGSDSAPMIQRWNGSAWAIVPVPDPSPLSDGLEGISPMADGSLWAVGWAAGGAETLILRWNGRSWRRVSSPSPGATAQLRAVTTRRDGPPVAIGSFVPGDRPGETRTLSLHRVGGTWRRFVSPDPGSYRNVLAGLDRGPHTLQKIWAVGWRERSAGDGARPLVLRLVDDVWVVERVPNPYPEGWTELEDVAVFGVPTFDAVGAVAVGNAHDPATGDYPAVILRRCSP